MLEIVRKRPVFCLLTVAFLLRIVAGWVLQYRLDHVWHRPFLIPGDAEGYWELAKNLVHHHRFEIYDPPRQIMRMPGFPALLAACMSVFGENWMAFRVVLAAVGTAACGLVYVLGLQLFDRPTALLAAALAAFSPVMIGFSELVLSETLFAATLLISVIALVWYDGCRRAARPGSGVCWLQAAAAGVAIGLATYVRPSWLPVAGLAAVLALLASRGRRSAWIEAGLIVAGVTVALAPWAWRNYQVTGHVVVTTLWAGPSLYDGLHSQADGTSDMQFYEDDALMNRHGYSEYEMNRHYTRRAVNYAAAHPGRALELALTKLRLYWSPWPNSAQFSDWRLRAMAACWFSILMLPACIGWVSTWKRPGVWLPTVGPLLLFAAVHAVFVGSIRYRLPAEYPLCVLSAAGIQNLTAYWRSTR